MPLVVRAYPLVVPVEELRAFVERITTADAENTARMYREYGVSHESWHLQETPNGPWLISVAAMDDPAEGGARFAASTDAYDAWFKQRVLALSGVDAERQPLGPPTTQVFSWSDERRPDCNLSAIGA